MNPFKLLTNYFSKTIPPVQGPSTPDSVIIIHREYVDFTDKSLKLINNLLKYKDDSLPDHHLRVSGLCIQMGNKLGLSHTSVYNLELAGRIHDIGKVIISSNILNKKEPLNKMEEEIVKSHPIMAINMLKNLKINREITEAILHHHEYWNGSGYPGGMKKRSIPIGARILSVADHVDNMVYKEKLTSEALIDYLSNNSRILFDPEVVEATLSNLS